MLHNVALSWSIQLLNILILQVATNLQAITIIPAFQSELTNSYQNGAEKKKIGETG